MAFNKAVPDFERYKLTVQTRGDHTLQPTRDSTNDLATWQTWRRGRSLGEGGFGEVHQQVWEDEHHDLHYRAVKVCKQRTMEAMKIDYKRELSTIAAFSNSQVSRNFLVSTCADLLRYSGFFVNLHGWWIASGQVFIAMEYLRYGDLSRYGITGLSETEIKEITRNILQGLEVMHKYGFTHRDIKPQNVLVVQKRPEFPSWWVKIADFGISKCAFEDSGTALRTVIGTRGYRAPEMLGLLDDHLDTSVYTSKVDIWSLGCLVFYIGSQGGEPFSDIELMRFCDGRGTMNPRNRSTCFNNNGILFVKALLQAQPEQRPTATEALQHSWLAAMDTTVSDTNSMVPGKPDPTPQQYSNSFLSSAPSTSPSLPRHQTDLTVRPHMAASTSRTSTLPDRPHPTAPQNFNSFLDSAPSTGSLPPPKRTDLAIPPAIPAPTKETLAINKTAARTSIDTRNDIRIQDSSLRSYASQSPSAEPLKSNQIHAPTEFSNLLRTQARQVRLDEWCKKHERLMNFAIYQRGIIPLHWAARDGDLDVMESMVEQGADVKATDKHGWTPLHEAAAKGHLAAAKWLKERGADVQAKDRHNGTPLTYAAWSGPREMVKWLKEQGADIDVKSRIDGRTPLHQAIYNRNLERVKWLKELGANIEAKMERGRTPLYCAVLYNNLDGVKCLTQLGADTNARDYADETPLHLAAQQGFLDIAKWLKQHGADIETKDDRGWTPLHYAAERGFLDVVKWLTEEGASTGVKNEDGKTPRDIAKRSMNFKVMRWLGR